MAAGPRTQHLLVSGLQAQKPCIPSMGVSIPWISRCSLHTFGPKVGMIYILGSLPAPPNYPLRHQIPSNRDHKALNRGTLGGLGRAWVSGLKLSSRPFPGMNSVKSPPCHHQKHSFHGSRQNAVPERALRPSSAPDLPIFWVLIWNYKV